MEINIKSDARIFVIEGIAGAGKNTFHRKLQDQLAGRLIYDYHEEELLFSWKHGWLKNINEMRIAFYENFLDYCEQILSTNPQACFIANRFHISYQLFARSSDRTLAGRYEAIVKRLAGLGAVVFVVTLDDELIESRSAHVERTDPIWKEHLRKRLAQGNFATLREMYSDEQKRIISLVSEQKLPYQIIKNLNV